MSDIEQLDLCLINLKDDEASAQGTKVVCYLVQRLHKAQDNLALSRIVQALIRARPNNRQEWEKSLYRDSFPKQWSLHVDNRLPKRQRSESSSSLAGKVIKDNFIVPVDYLKTCGHTLMPKTQRLFWQ